MPEYLHRFTLRIFTTTFSLLVMLIASNTSLYLPRPSFRTSWKSSWFLARKRKLVTKTSAWLKHFMVQMFARGSTRHLPPFNYVGLIVPVLPGPMSVDLSVHSGPAWHGSWHVRQLGRNGGEISRQRRMVGVWGGWVGREGGRGGEAGDKGSQFQQGKGFGGALLEDGEGALGARWDSWQERVGERK